MKIVERKKKAEVEAVFGDLDISIKEKFMKTIKKVKFCPTLHVETNVFSLVKKTLQKEKNR